MYKLSIVVPVYKVEKYIEECLDSILQQITCEVQIICVDDGTPDKSIKIAKNLVSSYCLDIQKQFVWIEQENKGLSEARNIGINKAEGQYIGFLDSDDILLPNYISTLLSIISEKKYDIIDFNLVTSLDEHLRIYEESTNHVKGVFKKGEWFASARVFNKNFLGDDRFIPNIYYEDIGFVPFMYIKSKQVKHIDEALYWYRVNPEGITSSKSYQNNIKTIESFEKILNICLIKYENSNDGSKFYLASIILQTYFLLCVNSCRRFSLNNGNKYLNEYGKRINEIYTYTNSNIDIDRKVDIFLNNSKLYLVIYNAYCLLKYRKKNHE